MALARGRTGVARGPVSAASAANTPANSKPDPRMNRRTLGPRGSGSILRIVVGFRGFGELGGMRSFRTSVLAFAVELELALVRWERREHHVDVSADQLRVRIGMPHAGQLD